MNIRDIMTHDIVVIGIDESLLTVSTLFAHAHFHHLIVVEREKICGVLSDRDLFKASSPFLGTSAERREDSATLQLKVSKIMTRDPIVLLEDATVMDAIGLFDMHPISCIPVVNSEQRPVGIVSWRDIFHALLQRKAQRLN